MNSLKMKTLGMLCLIAVTAFTMTSCEKAVSTTTVETPETLESIVLANTILNPVTGAMENVDGLMTDVVALGAQRPDSVRPGKKTPPPFRCMRLTEEQRRQIAQFMKEQRECEQPIRESYRQALQELKETMNQKRREIEAYKNSPDVNRERLAAMIKEAREYEQAQMRALRIRFEEAIQACVQQLHRKVESILTDEQLRIWNQWKETGKGCEPSTRQ